MPFRLTPPAQATLLISLVLAILAVILHYARIELPIVGTHTFGLLLLGYLVLLAGNLFEGVQAPSGQGDALSYIRQVLDPRLIAALVALAVLVWVGKRVRRRWKAFMRLLTFLS